MSKIIILLSSRAHVLKPVLSSLGYSIKAYNTHDIQNWNRWHKQVSNSSQEILGGLVYNFGKIIPANIVKTFNFINIHFSLLPKYRGANPVGAAILNGDLHTGITFHKVVEQLDAGNIVYAQKFEIPKGLTTGELFEFLENKLLKLLPKVLVPTIWKEPGNPQKGDISFASKFSKKLANLNPCILTAQEVERRILAFNPEPLAYFKVLFDLSNGKGEKLKVRKLVVYKAKVLDAPLVVKPGEFVFIRKQGLYLGTLVGTIFIESAAIEGKKKLNTDQLLTLKGKIIKAVCL